MMERLGGPRLKLMLDLASWDTTNSLQALRVCPSLSSHKLEFTWSVWPQLQCHRRTCHHSVGRAGSRCGIHV